MKREFYGNLLIVIGWSFSSYSYSSFSSIGVRTSTCIGLSGCSLHFAATGARKLAIADKPNKAPAV